MTRRLGFDCRFVAGLGHSPSRSCPVSAGSSDGQRRAWSHMNGARLRRSPAKMAAPSNGCRSSGADGSAGFRRPHRLSAQGIAVRHGAHGNARHLFLCAARDDGKCERPVPARRHHGVVSATCRRCRIAPSTTRSGARSPGRRVKVRPGGRAHFRVEREPNHYYVARETDAAPLPVGPERERFLFYRGVGRIPPPIAASVSRMGRSSSARRAGGRSATSSCSRIAMVRWRITALQTSATSRDAQSAALEPEGEGPSPQIELRKGSRRTRPVPSGSEGDGGQLARLVVRARHAALLHRLGRGGRHDASAADRASIPRK